MTSTSDAQHDESSGGAGAVAELVAMAAQRRPEQPLLPEFIERYYRGLPDDDLDERPIEATYAAAIAHFEMGFRRQPGEVLTELTTPDRLAVAIDARNKASSNPEELGAVDGSVLMCVNDDVPFIVDSVRIALDQFDVGIRLLVHPMLTVERNADGDIMSVSDAASGTATDSSGSDLNVEAWTQIQLDQCPADLEATIAEAVAEAIANVIRVVDDFRPMQDRLRSMAGVHAEFEPLLTWLADRHFVFLGAASYLRTNGEAEQPTMTLIDGSELGEFQPDGPLDASQVWPPSKSGPAQDAPLVIARTDTLSTVHRHVRMNSLAIRVTDDDGTVIEHRFIGLLGSGAYRESVFAIPVLGDRAREVIGLAHADENSYVGRAIKNVVDTLPRDLAFELDAHDLAQLVIDIVGLQERRIVRLFEVAEPVGDYTTVFVFLPKVRFESGLADRVSVMVGERAGGDVRDVRSSVDSSSLARIVMTVRVTEPLDLEHLAEHIDRRTAPWSERALAALADRFGENVAAQVAEAVSEAVPNTYQARVDPIDAVDDLVKVAGLCVGGASTADIDTALVRPGDSESGQWRFKIFRRGTPAIIAELVPLLDHLGLRAIDEYPAQFDVHGGPVFLYDIGVEMPELDEAARGAPVEHTHSEAQRAFRALVEGTVEPDGLNRLVLAAELTLEQVAVLRCYSRYLQQAGFPFSQGYIEEVLVEHSGIAHSLSALFDARFDPASEPHPGESPVVVNAIRTEIRRHLDDVPSLDHDRICRAILTLIDATKRTNVFQVDSNGERPSEVAIKLDAQSIPFLPEPRPMFEIFVCSPKVEGVHLRAGPVARGGLRWSDRREDYRTEVLGLVKAQMVKNAVIVPVGAKGGFVVKQSTAPPGDRDAVVAEGIDRYQRFVRSLLALTDNLAVVDGVATVVHPDQTVIYDDDDTYLVVAADKGTASFSDIANKIAVDAGFWLGDAFASGGSHGYDHKAMGITARGAWESVRRHARVLGKDVDCDELSVVGVGDMSGDVFGNGMLLSEHLSLVAAFDHRDIFLDPNPDPATSFAERTRLFDLPRSSWKDYASDLISEGGGVYSRSSKAVPVSAQVAEVLGIDSTVSELTPNELMAAILRAPVDLLWNGGIGTYVKASNESNEDVGDRSNDAIRVDAADLRCRIVGEGGNLGLTQLARVEYALNGGLIYTDAIDNSAGVDCSDHEVNIKIALAQLLARGSLTMDERNELLAEMTDDVAELVLDDNRAQTLALMIARTQSLPMVNVHARYLDSLEAEGHLDRALDDLPNDKQIAERQSVGSGLRTPEFAVMIASTKNVDIAEIMQTDLPDSPVLEPDLLAYFPPALRQRFPDALREHRLRREIVATGLVNSMVNLSGISFDHRMTEQFGATLADVARAFVASREIVGFRQRWADVEQLGSSIDLDTQIELFLDARRMAERAAGWLLRRRRAPLDMGAAIAEFQNGFGELTEAMTNLVTGRVEVDITELTERRVEAGVPPELAARSARWPWLHTSFDIIEVAGRQGCDLIAAARTYWSVFDAFDVGWLWDEIGALPRSDRWQTQARASLRDDLLTVGADLTANVLRTADGSPQAWMAQHEGPVARMFDVVTEIRRAETFDLTTLSVALRQLRNLTVAATP